MAQAFVLGNGVSRQGVDLHQLQIRGPIYGCNALYRDFEPDVLVATDRAIAEHIQHHGYALTRSFYTRSPIEGMGAQRIPEPWWKFSSGQVAVALAAQAGYGTVWMLGFDLGPDTTNKFNNVYAGSEFYKAVGSVPTYTGNWVQQTLEICRQFAKTQFKRVTGPTTARIAEFEGVPNLATVTLQQFLQQVNNG
jgi:hypothetical protein